MSLLLGNTEKDLQGKTRGKTRNRRGGPVLKYLFDALKPKEKDIKREIRAYLNIRGLFCWNQWQGQMSVKGVPDIVGLFPKTGRLFAVEVKTDRGKVRPEQQDFLDRINAEGGLAFVARSVEDVMERIR